MRVGFCTAPPNTCPTANPFFIIIPSSVRQTPVSRIHPSLSFLVGSGCSNLLHICLFCVRALASSFVVSQSLHMIAHTYIIHSPHTCVCVCARISFFIQSSSHTHTRLWSFSRTTPPLRVLFRTMHASSSSKVCSDTLHRVFIAHLHSFCHLVFTSKTLLLGFWP